MELLLLLFLFMQDPQVKAPPKPMPPDLIHVQNPSCTIIQHGVQEVLNAKTGEPDTIYAFRVEPYATYDDNREKWELPKEQIPHGKEERPGAIGEFQNSHEAIDACLAWTDSVKKAKIKELEKMGQDKKK